MQLSATGRAHRLHRTCCCGILLQKLSMLGLRTTSFGQRSPGSLNTGAPFDTTSTIDDTTTMAASQNGPDKEASTSLKTQPSPPSTANTFTNEEPLRKYDGSRDGTKATNGFESRNGYHHKQTTVLQDAITATRTGLIADFEQVTERSIESTTLDSFLGYLEQERLTHMPHRGSRWDRVLRWARFYAIQVSEYERAISEFMPDSKNAATLIYVACRVFLEFGPENAQALEVTFEAFFKLGMSLGLFVRHHHLLHVDSNIRTETGEAFKEMLILVHDVGRYYGRRVNDVFEGSMSFVFNDVFERQIDAFYRRKTRIIEAMWKHQLGEGASDKIGQVREWLSLRDHTLETILHSRSATLARRAEYTCEWFQRHLLEFCHSGHDVLAVHGPEGCGKTSIYGWIVERLQRSLGNNSYQTLSHTIYSDVPQTATCLAVVRSLTLQLLEISIGDVVFFTKLVDALKISTRSTEPEKAERVLWEALDEGVKNSTLGSKNIIIIIDGLNETRGGQQVSHEIADRLTTLTKKHKRARLITFSRSEPPKKDGTQLLGISADDTHGDVRHVVEQSLRNYAHYKSQSEFEREKIVEQIVHNAKGSFLWASLSLASLKDEKSHAGFMKLLKEGPKTTDEIIQKVLSTLDLSSANVKLLLGWLLNAERPLTVGEVKCLMRVDLQKKALVDPKVAINDIERLFGHLVTVQNGAVAFYHGYVRSYLYKSQGEKDLPALKVAQTDLTTRLLAYCAFSLTNPRETSFECIDVADANQIFRTHHLLEYAVRNWASHFRGSTMIKSSGGFEIPAECKALFPVSTGFALLEWYCWESQAPLSQAVTMHELALRVRQEIFSEKHESVLQNLIICGSLYEKLARVKEASGYFYNASRIGQTVLRQYHKVILMCTTKFLSITETMTSTTRTEIVTRKEEMIKFMISACKHQYSSTHDLVIQYYKSLARLYVDIHENESAEKIWREVHEIVILRHGQGSEEEARVSKELFVVLKRVIKHENIIEYDRCIFDTTQEIDIWDEHRIKVIRQLAQSYHSRGDLILAEEQYVILWRRLMEFCHDLRQANGLQMHFACIDVAIEYVRFLKLCKRDEEASSILMCVWMEYEACNFESEQIFLCLKTVAELMREVRLLSVAVLVFKKCWGWFASHGKHEYSSSCEVMISETVKEITTQTVTVKTITTETTVKEVFESTISRTTVTSETISVCNSIISLYVKQERWTEAIEVIQKSLSSVWQMIISGSGTVALPSKFDSEAIGFAIHLALCHLRVHHYHEAEEIYLRIYRACRVSCGVEDERLIRTYDSLIKFYEEHRNWEKLIKIHKEMLAEYRKHLGSSHHLTIKTLYILGSLCSEHGHGYSNEYYELIVTVLNGNAKVCHKDAVKAMIILCQVYFEDGQWQKLKGLCQVLWETWIHHNQNFKFDSNFIEVLHARYIYVLEHHDHYEYENLRTIHVEFRDTCVKVFGISNAITVKAMVELAHICLKSEKHIHEAIKIYEEVITTTKSTTTTATTTTTITTVKEQLSKAYVKVCSHESTSVETISRAIKVVSERYEHLRITYGYAQSQTLVALRELVVLHKKRKTQEADSVVVRLLVESTLEILQKETHSKTLYDAATIIGGIFKDVNLVDDGLEVLWEMRRQIITKSYIAEGKHHFKVDKSVGKTSYIFLATWETVIQGSSISFSEVMTDILAESALYEVYVQSRKSESHIEMTLTHAARLYNHLTFKRRAQQAKILEKEAFEIFLKKWGGTLKTSREISLAFFICLLEQLGNEEHHINIGTAACRASEKLIRDLESGKVQEGYEKALCAFNFIRSQRYYHNKHNIGYGFNLSSYLAGRGLETSPQNVDPHLRKHMLELSREIIRDVIEASKELEFDFVRFNLGELNQLIDLLGQQENYSELEVLLSSLWSSREERKDWSVTTIISIGRRLVETRFLLGSPYSKAIRLCEDICYNLRQALGALDHRTLDMLELLSQLYTSAGHHREAMGVHEDILRLAVEGDDDGNKTIEAPFVLKHLHLLKRCYQRLGGWDKSATTYKRLVDDLIRMKQYGGTPEWKGVQSIDKWNVKEKPDRMGEFVPPTNWEFAGQEYITEESSENGSIVSGRHRLGFRHAVSHWGSEMARKISHGHLRTQEKHGDKGAKLHHGRGNGRAAELIPA